MRTAGVLEVSRQPGHRTPPRAQLNLCSRGWSSVRHSTQDWNSGPYPDSSSRRISKYLTSRPAFGVCCSLSSVSANRR